MRNYFPIILLVLATSIGCSSRSARERPRPIEVDFDMENIEQPAEDSAPQYYDFFDRTFTKPVHQALDMPRNFRKIAGNPKEAENVDSMDEVPNSSWFTNRNAKKAMTVDEIERGPNQGDGPHMGTWTVTRGKTQGVTPGFTVKDERGDRYIIKFDPPVNPEMSTAAEMISTKLFYACGYNTPENYLVHFDASQLVIHDDAKIVDPLGNKRLMKQKDLERILSRVYRRDDGKYRAVASKFLPGLPIGPYSYHGTRKDDPNDIIPHEHRRELRGLRLIAAWLEHNDVRRMNSLDIYTEQDGRKFVQHYLIDFGATLGSASLFPNLAREGHEYIFDAGETLKSVLSLGLYNRRWRRADEPVHATVGHYESELFNPRHWKPNYPNPAFENMTERDAFWATRIILSFSDEQLRAAVESGGLSDPEAADYLAQTLIERRDKVAAAWLPRTGSMANFRMENGRLFFDDLAVQAGLLDRSNLEYVIRLTDAADPSDVLREITVSGTDAAFGIDLGTLPDKNANVSISNGHTTTIHLNSKNMIGVSR